MTSLAKLSTIKLIADYMVSVQNKHRADWVEEIERRRTARLEEEEGTAENDETAAVATPTSPPLINIVGSYIIFDGQPLSGLLVVIWMELLDSVLVAFSRLITNIISS
jgi:hypothetical protein